MINGLLKIIINEKNKKLKKNKSWSKMIIFFKVLSRPVNKKSSLFNEAI